MRMVHLPPRAAAAFKALLHRKVGNRSIEEADVLHNLHTAKVNDLLVVHDRDDFSVPFESAETIVEKYPGARLLITHGYGHFALMKQEEVIGRVVDFVVSHD